MRVSLIVLRFIRMRSMSVLGADLVDVVVDQALLGSVVERALDHSLGGAEREPGQLAGQVGLGLGAGGGQIDQRRVRAAAAASASARAAMSAVS